MSSRPPARERRAVCLSFGKEREKQKQQSHITSWVKREENIVTLCGRREKKKKKKEYQRTKRKKKKKTMNIIFGGLWWVLSTVSLLVGLFSVVTYLVGIALQQLVMRIPQDLKKKYDAEWAVVTGASSGIGKAITEKLAQQQINVVLVALEEPALHSTFAELQKKYPKCSFRKVGVDLGGEGMRYMAPIIEATQDIDVALLFNNAGYLQTGLFTDTEVDRLRANLECNACCAIPITHHFLRKMLERQRRGLVAFTSSCAGYLPGPTATLYSPSKAFLTNFAVTIAAEVRHAGIHVVAMHPSPVNTNFFKHKGPTLSTIEVSRKMVSPPSHVADQLFASAGRLTVWDQGTTTAAFRWLNKLFDFQFFMEVIVRIAKLSGDHKKLVEASKIHRRKRA
ncbi:hypothetical protein MOQ_008639 [Trypanosoma cruzi marinkellei]|uniref:Short-chain dehydrogenase n=1 Tax=Trypanosoma cruzi marinkellei TaxID=85056 RepID=K2MPT4_TRYCR|nr:hypothetical protein MOQ_008639 [Trypanosoma cruzi marinkellei]